MLQTSERRRRPCILSPRSACALAVLSLLVGAGATRGQDVPAGDELVVNTYTTSTQNLSSVSTDAAGNFVVVWQSNGQDGDGLGVFGQRFDSSGKQLGAEFQVNTTTTNIQRSPSVASDASGNFVVVWQSLDQDGSVYGAIGRRYDSSGSALGGEFVVNDYTTFSQKRPVVASDDSGNFVVAWQTTSGLDGDNYGIFARRFDSSGTALGGDFQVNTFATGSQDTPAIASDASGNFIVVWESATQPVDSQDGIFAQRYDTTGSPVGSEFHVNTYTTFNQKDPSVAADADGNFVVTWHSSSQDGSEYGIFAQRFDSSGTTVGSEFQVNAQTTSTQIRPAVSSDPSGNFVVTWNGYSQDGDSTGIFGRRLDRSGSPLGDEFQVNTYTISAQRDSSVASDSAGNFVVTWHSYGPDGDFSSVAAQRFATNHVGDRVFVDSNLDGLQSAGESGQPNVMVHLFESLGPLLSSTMTDGDGMYRFDVIPPGDVFVQFELPTDYSFAARDAGNDALDSDPDRFTGETDTFPIAAGETRDEWDAGLARGVGNFVWRDDGDGVQEVGEMGVAGVTVRLYDEFAALAAEETTDASGFFGLDVTSGDFILEVVPPTGYAFTLENAGGNDFIDSDIDPATGFSPPISIALGDVQPFWDAGLIQLSQVSDFVWRDLDGDGIQDGFESGIEGVTVRLFNSADALVMTTVTDEDGHYYFTGVPDGQYRIEVLAPLGLIPTLANQGSDDALDSDLDAGGRSPLFFVVQLIERTIDGGFVPEPPLFADGFESGDTTAWSSVTPLVSPHAKRGARPDPPVLPTHAFERRSASMAQATLLETPHAPAWGSREPTAPSSDGGDRSGREREEREWQAAS